jgi:hypothetical protein
LVGMSRIEHVRENLAVSTVPAVGAEDFRRLLG